MEKVEGERRKGKMMPLGVPFILFYIAFERYGTSGILGNKLEILIKIFKK
jgi:hypothetical protein